jgi:hypothetical protein
LTVSEPETLTGPVIPTGPESCVTPEDTVRLLGPTIVVAPLSVVGPVIDTGPEIATEPLVSVKLPGTLEVPVIVRPVELIIAFLFRSKTECPGVSIPDACLEAIANGADVTFNLGVRTSCIGKKTPSAEEFVTRASRYRGVVKFIPLKAVLFPRKTVKTPLVTTTV